MTSYTNLLSVIQVVNGSQKNILFSVIAVQETWGVKEDFNIARYQNFIYKTRKDISGGGIGFFVREGIEYEILDEPSIFEARIHESLFIRVTGGNNNGIVIGNVYRPNTHPFSNIKKSTSLLSKSIEHIRQRYKNDTIIIVGDFNIDLVSDENNSTSDFISELTSKGFLELITVPTRVTDTSETLLDHIWASTSYCSTSGVLDSGISDHYSTFLLLEQKIKPANKSPTFQKRTLKEANISSLKEALAQTDWSPITSTQNPVLSYNAFFQTFYKEFNIHCPIVTKKSRSKKDIPLHPWMTKGLLISRKKKEKLLKLKTKLKTTEAKSEFNTYKKIYEKVIAKSKIIFYKNEFNSAISNPKKTWDLLREATKLGGRKAAAEVPSTFREKNKVTNSKVEVANGFNDFFATVGSNLANEINLPCEPAEHSVEKSNKVFKFTQICRESIIVYASKLKNKHSTGWDGLSSYVLKQVIHLLIDPLTHIFNLSLSTGYIPPEFKVARVIPLHKCGEKDLYGNYRPISLLPTFSKLFEYIVNEQIRSFFNCFKLFTKSQFGFRLGSEPAMAVSKFVDAIFKAQNEISLGIFIDAKKAFDTIDHNILLKKLERYGFRGPELKLVENYLKNRFQVTEVDGVVSSLVKILAGVPQGSILGPLLFIIYINDLPAASGFNSFLFADDTSFHLCDKNLKDLQVRANAELEQVERWFNSNKMVLNSKKTKYILFGVPKSQRKTNFELKIGGEILNRVSESNSEKFVKLVGIALDENLSFKYHINHIKAKLNQANFILARSGKFLTKGIRILVYNSLVKSVLEFGCWVYGHCGKTLLDTLFKIQKKIIRNVVGVKGRTHTNALFIDLNFLKLPDIIDYNTKVLGCKIYYNRAPRNLCDGFEKFSSLRETRSTTEHLLNIPYCKNIKKEGSPCFSIPKCWNGMCLSLKKIDKLGKFKSALHTNYINDYRREPICTIKNCFSCSVSAR